MNGWTWDGTAPAAAGCGVSDAEDRARQAAEAWLSANPHRTAVLGTARLDDGPTTLSAHWVSTGRARRDGMSAGYSTVTLLARFLGLSMSQPRNRAI